MQPNGSRLERLQAAQDRLLRYAHFRLGEELMKSSLGASNLPTAPSSPGLWDVEYNQEHADALGLEPNSYEVFVKEKRQQEEAIGTRAGSGSKLGFGSSQAGRLGHESSSILPHSDHDHDQDQDQDQDQDYNHNHRSIQTT